MNLRLLPAQAHLYPSLALEFARLRRLPASTRPSVGLSKESYLKAVGQPRPSPHFFNPWSVTHLHLPLWRRLPQFMLQPRAIRTDSLTRR